MKKQTVAIVGFGRFGQTLYRLIKKDFSILIIGKTNPQDIKKAKIIFYCVPISKLTSVINSHKKYFQDNQLIIDVLSVKIHPQKILKKLTKTKNVQVILTHPMFGPDSSKNGFENLPLVMWNLNAKNSQYQFWKNYFLEKKLKIIEIDPKTHDKLAAYSQGVTHFLGRILQTFNFKPTQIDTLGAKKLHEIMDQTCNDTWQLFNDLQNYNPFTTQMRLKIGKAYEKIYEKLFQSPYKKKIKIFGIQGGKGSFNEQAILYYLKNQSIKKYKIKYLYTTKNVFKNLYLGKIDIGIFALYNNTAGLVEETLKEIGKYRFKIIEVIKLPIRHFLMIKKDVSFNQINQIIAHPQVLRQCENNLKNKYPRIKTLSLTGNLIDTAKAALALAKNQLPKTTAILGPENLTSLYDFQIIDKDLQDNPNNQTIFLVVKL